MPKHVKLDRADSILIDLVEKAHRAGSGHSFKFKDHRIHVVHINDKSVYLRLPNDEEMVLPRNIKEIAVKTAMLMGRVE